MKQANGKHAGGRPTKKTPEMVALLAAAIAEGMSFKSAAHLCGINSDTFWDWMKNDEEFSDKIKSARAVAVSESVQAIRSRLPQWQAMAWWLERIEYEDWGSKQRIEHTGKDGDKLSLVWPWEVAMNGTNGSSPGTTPDTGNGSSLHSEIPRSRVRSALGEDGP